MIRTPNGKLISKTTAVTMLKEMHLSGTDLSKDRLKRIEQCAAASTRMTQQLVEHNGTHLEMFQDVAIAFDDGPTTPVRVELGRIQKLVSCVGKRSRLVLTSVPLEKINGIEVRCRFYERVGRLAFKYCAQPDDKRYSAQSILMVVELKYHASEEQYTLTDLQWEDIQSELRKLQTSTARAKRVSQRVRKQRQERHRQEARAIQLDRRARCVIILF